MIVEATKLVVESKNLTYKMAYAVLDEIMQGTPTPAQVGSYLTALSMKGATIDEITASAAAMRMHCVKLLHDAEVLEIVGTGGDKAGTFNISTTASLLISAAGIPVAKHGNRAATSLSGSADVLEALGVNINLTPEQSVALLKEIGICFLFAQNYHVAMKNVAPIRREIGVRTIFNILGPLSNPAGATMQVLGVYDGALVEPIAQVLANLGVRRAFVIHGHDGLDEISACSATSVCEVRDGELNSFIISPEDFGLTRGEPGDLRGGTPAENAEITRSILAGELGVKRTAVVLNAGAGLYIGGKTATLAEGVALAERLIDSGAAYMQMELFAERSNTIAQEDATILDRIVACTKRRVITQRAEGRYEGVKAAALGMPAGETFRFEEALRSVPFGFICEVKKASPSKGVLVEEFNPVDIAVAYEQAGATAISCLTEPQFFQGSNKYLSDIVGAVSIPVLRKDFIVDDFMIYEAKTLGASAVLLIARILSDKQLATYIQLSHSLGMSALVEVNTPEEAQRALSAGALIVGVNNRDLATFSVDLATTRAIAGSIPDSVLLVSESGIQNAVDIAFVRECGARAALVGETLMRAENIAACLGLLKEGARD